MNQHKHVVALCALILAVFAMPVSAAVINIRTEKGGKLLLVVDDESIRTAAGAKPVLVIDGPNILTEKGGKRLFFIDGDILHANVPEGPVAGYKDGRHVKTAPGGKELFYIDGAIIRPDHDGKALYYVDGEVMNNPQLMAVLYTLRPELFPQVKDAGGAVPAEAPAAAAASVAAAAPQAAAAPAGGSAKEFTGGTYSIAAFKSSDNAKRAGTITIKKQGDIFAMDLKYAGNEPLQGVAVSQNGELWAGVGNANTVGLAVYKIAGGNLTGTWMNITGDSSKFGTENLTGAATIGGKYNIASAKAPFTGAPYAGTVTLKAVQTDSPDPAFYHFAWNMGGYKAEGVGFKSADSLIAATSTGPEFSVIRFKIDPATNGMVGNFYTSSRATGTYTLTRDGD